MFAGEGAGSACLDVEERPGFLKANAPTVTLATRAPSVAGEGAGLSLSLAFGVILVVTGSVVAPDVSEDEAVADAHDEEREPEDVDDV